MKYMHILTAFLLVFNACKKKPPSEPENGFDPNKPSFRKGTKWTYVYTAYDQSGATVNSSENQYSVVRDATVNGTKYFIDSYGTYFRYKSDGAYFFEKSNNREVLFFKYPANMNDTYSILPAGPFCAPNTYIEVKNTDTTFTYNSINYEKLAYYLFNYIIQTCQGTNSSAKYLYSTKIGLFVYNRQRP